jgi:hypothetical protein
LLAGCENGQLDEAAYCPQVIMPHDPGVTVGVAVGVGVLTVGVAVGVDVGVAVGVGVMVGVTVAVGVGVAVRVGVGTAFNAVAGAGIATVYPTLLPVADLKTPANELGSGFERTAIAKNEPT